MAKRRDACCSLLAISYQPPRLALTSEGPMKHIVILIATALLTLGNAALAADSPPGAVACSGCHPAKAGVDSPVPRLIGRDAAQIVAAMGDFRAGKRPTTIMDRIAKGFTEDEVKAIAAWFAAQKD
jgi:sulfide dehydrogenase cytochrome subunit